MNALIEMESFRYLKIFLIFISTLSSSVAGTLSLRNREDKSSVSLVNVRSFGARANDHRDHTKAFLAAWDKACKSSSSSVHLIIPRGEFSVGPLRFSGPCTNVSNLTVRVKGHLKASTDLSKYRSGGGWINFEWINGLTLTGGGTFDGQGALAWPFNNCTSDSKCKLLPTSLKFVGMNRTVVRRISSVNSKFFHIALVECRDFKGTRLNITAPSDSPNTDGIHIERSSNVYFSRSHIATGDDCVSIGQGNSRITITSIKCGPGHGISVGSLGRYPNEKNVKGLVVKDCKMSGTTNGIRIKTWANSPGLSAATNMTFQNIIMNNVTNPIIIDQSYCPFSSCITNVPSKVKLSDIYFKNIRGTSSSRVAVQLHCSRGMPCKKVYLENVHLDLSSSFGGRKQSRNRGDEAVSSSCRNVRVNYIGTQLPPPCH
ncbi:PREDICTED: exopolygalacturonase-like [Camelina sativa]|uniref:Exopolygalacturonase-like n=1 Tax=Camelina sativa TaxID=90675 RepID=A0ABM1QQS3_CAMSA|nr:PREDICTED: exopolygalacturonase-like [Camelina sativa]